MDLFLEIIPERPWIDEDLKIYFNKFEEQNYSFKQPPECLSVKIGVDSKLLLFNTRNLIGDLASFLSNCTKTKS